MVNVTARVVRLEGVEGTCFLLMDDSRFPEELVVDFPSGSTGSTLLGRSEVIFRLQPSSKNDPTPTYVEIFDD